MFFTVPTLLTWTRIIAIPLLVGVFYALMLLGFLIFLIVVLAAA